MRSKSKKTIKKINSTKNRRMGGMDFNDVRHLMLDTMLNVRLASLFGNGFPIIRNDPYNADI